MLVGSNRSGHDGGNVHVSATLAAMNSLVLAGLLLLGELGAERRIGRCGNASLARNPSMYATELLLGGESELGGGVVGLAELHDAVEASVTLLESLAITLVFVGTLKGLLGLLLSYLIGSLVGGGSRSSVGIGHLGEESNSSGSGVRHDERSEREKLGSVS